MDIITPDWKKWDAFCLKNSSAWFWHTSDWLEYSRQYSPSVSDESFMVTENNQLLAVCPLLIGGMNWAPAAADGMNQWKRDQVLDTAFEHINILAITKKVKSLTFQISPLTQPKNNWLMKYGYLEESINSQMLDLSAPLADILRGMRKGHNYDVDRSTKLLRCWVLDNNITDSFQRYQYLHTVDASRMTRPQKTFDLQEKWVKDGTGIIVEATLDGSTVGFAYINMYKKGAYYMSACSDPSIKGMPIGHAIIWRAIEYLKDHGITDFELGWQQYGSQIHDFPSEKEIEISRFKRGFGGYTLPLFRGTMYYTKTVFASVMGERTERMIA